ncbi:MAG: insulinase family protein, partial [Bacteroidota bacterium]
MRFFYVFLLALPLFATSVTAQDQTNVDLPAEPDVLDIPYTKFTLDNGLTLIVHEDRKAPIAAVNVWYHVGSKNETPGRTGFAHLFEHLMFNGSENYDDDYFQVLERIGATDLNGTTNNDRTNYFQNVPVNALDRALWMESDRMGHLLGAIDQGKLDEQRDVVKNEKRQGENQPYGRVFSTIFENVYPEGHPYSWPVIGSMEDLNAASLDDVKEWFERYYGAANAVVVIAGDIDPETAKQKVETYFGDITPGPPVTKAQRWIPKWDTPRRATMEDRVPQARVYLTWNMPEWGSADADDLELFSDVLTYGKTSRLYKRLVYEDQVATNANSFAYGQEIAGMFVINASVAPGADMAAVEAAIREEVQQLLEDGPTQQELNRVVTLNVANFVRGAERIGGFGGKSDILAQSEVYGGAPDAYKNRLRRFKTATPERVVETARRWLKNNEFTLEVVPFPDYAAAETGADRSDLPPVDAPPAVDFPALQRATLSNGLDVVLAERHATPIVRMDLLVDAGYAADREHILGTASLAMNMLDEGAGSMNALEIA